MLLNYVTYLCCMSLIRLENVINLSSTFSFHIVHSTCRFYKVVLQVSSSDVDAFNLSFSLKTDSSCKNIKKNIKITTGFTPGKHLIHHNLFCLHSPPSTEHETNKMIRCGFMLKVM